MINHFPPFWVQSFPKSNSSHEKSIFPHLHFHQKRYLSLSEIFRPTQILKSNSNCYYNIEYSLKVHISNFRNGVKLTIREWNWGKWVITPKIYIQVLYIAENSGFRFLGKTLCVNDYDQVDHLMRNSLGLVSARPI